MTENGRCKIQTHEVELIRAALAFREQHFDYGDISKLKRCILKVRHQTAIRPNNDFVPCRTSREVDSAYVCENHCQDFGNSKLQLLTKYLSASLGKLGVLDNVRDLFNSVFDLIASFM